jgi:uncharacterized protein DUF1876
MGNADRWSVRLSVRELDGETHAQVRLIMDDGDELSGRGAARRHPGDLNVTEIGEHIALARALSDLAHHLLSAAAGEVEAVTHERARLHL